MNLDDDCVYMILTYCDLRTALQMRACSRQWKQKWLESAFDIFQQHRSYQSYFERGKIIHTCGHEIMTKVELILNTSHDEYVEFPLVHRYQGCLFCVSYAIHQFESREHKKHMTDFEDCWLFHLDGLQYEQWYFQSHHPSNRKLPGR